MKFPISALASISSAVIMMGIWSNTINEIESFQFGNLPRNRNFSLHRKWPVLSVSTTESNSKAQNDVLDDLSSGIDFINFVSVSDQNTIMENALKDARQIYLRRVEDGEVKPGKGEDRLVGINEEVVQEVGHELGNFSELIEDETILQRTAAYLRSKTQPGYFKPIIQTTDNLSTSEFTAQEISKYESLLRKAYQESGEVTEAFAKTFYLGTTLLPRAAQDAIWAIYVWCRRTDEIVDAPRNLGSDELNNAAMLQDLAAWELRLERLWDYGEVIDVYDLPLLDVRKNYPELQIIPFVDMIRGMLMDIPKLGVERYNEWEELHLYCYRVAGTVGLMSMPVFGTKKGVTVEDATDPALSLGVAFQITNILRDVGEDAKKRGRIYLPIEHLKKFNVSEEQIFAQRIDDNYRELVKYEIELARKYYEKAQEGVYMLSETGRLPVQTSLDCYRKILDKIEANNYDSLTTRAYVDKWEKLFTIPFSWYRTQEIHKTFPIPEQW